jgi:hypothetical protein
MARIGEQSITKFKHYADSADSHSESLKSRIHQGVSRLIK